ncbi:MAG TPA: polysaccharide deacetylase family protein [Firmicutes bacterium]|nr:polysaccharide deacetylase family protein [Bacillota bacterium]
MIIIIDLDALRRRLHNLLWLVVSALTLSLALVRPFLTVWVTSLQDQPIRRGNPDRPYVALMFNVDWGNEYVPQLLEILRQSHAKATFFVTGRWAGENPDLLRLIAKNEQEIATHGQEHLLPSKLPDQEVDWLIREGIATLRDILGREPALLFSPPSGDWDERTIRAASRYGCKTILWTVDTVDWRCPSPDKIVARATESVKPGSLILMHPTAPTVLALPKIIELLRRAGLEPTTVSQAIGA